jgi:hypothetical protein
MQGSAGQTPPTVNSPISLDERRQNFALLQAIADAVGKEYESKPMEELVGVDADAPATRVIDGISVKVTASARKRADDAVSVTVLLQSDLPVPLGARPAYTFRKRRDGSIFY